ncbi:MAG: thermonuclease family protein [Magnetococcales bacterium]|nr:thermonuclease family protein [Magnetococcales bacterium]
MNRLVLLCILLIATLSHAQQSESAQKVYPDISNVTYLSNYDGDTIRFNIPNQHPVFGQSISIRLRGIDTPELRGNTPQGREKAIKARDTVTKILQNAQTIHLTEVSPGKYFRIIARVLADGVDVGKLLLDKGLAITYKNRSIKDHGNLQPLERF